jgi:SAM-dependent methyltransferase
VAGHPDSILDVGAGTGEFTTVLREETDATVLALDADRSLLRAGEVTNALQGDAMRLPFTDDGVSLVTCQALLVNLPDPEAVLREFGRVASDRVGAVEPDNGAVTVSSTVEGEAELAGRARSYYAAGAGTDVSLGGDLAGLLERAGLEAVTVTRRDHTRTIEPPYDAAAVESARRKATASRLEEQRATLLAGGLTEAEFDALRDEWQSMGRSVAEQVRAGSYRREEVVPFYVGVGTVPGD